MKILLACFACAPNIGSEAGVGWRYIEWLSCEHDLWIITDTTREEQIKNSDLYKKANVNFIFYRPKFLKKLKLNSRTAHILYHIWCKSSIPTLLELDKKIDFDICWHLTYGVYRHPVWLWKLNKKFILGPVGGGESAPLRFFKSLPVKIKFFEFFRAILNKAVFLQPALHKSYAKADLVFVRTPETKALIPRAYHEKISIQQEIGGYGPKCSNITVSANDKPLNILFVGRLLGWKGIHIAITSVAKAIKLGANINFTIIGEGPLLGFINDLVSGFGIEDFVFIRNKIPQNELMEIYPKFDLFLFPSLHDSGGNVVLESLSYALPVICLDLGGPRCFVDESCGYILSTNGKTEEQLSTEISNVLINLSSNRDVISSLKQGAVERSNALTWSRQQTLVFGKIKSLFNFL